jgi:hypothetical protein
MTKKTGSSGSQVLGFSGSREQGERLPALFVGIVLTELAAILALYWFGAHFS